MSAIRRAGSPAPHAQYAALMRAVRSALEERGVPCTELRDETGGRVVVGAIAPTGRLVLVDILGAGSPFGLHASGLNHQLRAAGALVVPVHDQLGLVMLVDAVKRLRTA